MIIASLIRILVKMFRGRQGQGRDGGASGGRSRRAR